MTPTTLGLIGILLLPEMVAMAFNATSQCLGVCIAIAIWYTLITISVGYNRKIIKYHDLYIILLIIISIASFSLICREVFKTIDVRRLFASLAVLILVLVCASIISKYLFIQNGKSLSKTGNFGLVIIALLGLFSILGVPAIVPEKYEKPIIIFTEHSHYYLAVAPFLLFKICTVARIKRIAILLVAVVILAYFKSLTGLICILMAISLCFRKSVLFVFAVCIPLYLVIGENEYYTSRLNLNYNDNLSLLVYKSGLQRAIYNLQDSYGIGVGFQQFGIVGRIDENMRTIVSKYENMFNLYDGGAVAFKLIGELGIAGIIMLIAYLFLMIKSFIRMRNIAALKGVLSDRQMRESLHDSFILGASIELFVRGTGYFSGGIFLLLIALMGYKQCRSIRSNPLKNIILIFISKSFYVHENKGNIT